MSSIQFLSKVTCEMTNSRFVRLPLNMSVFVEMVDIFQEGLPWLRSAFLVLRGLEPLKVRAGSLYLAPAFAESQSSRLDRIDASVCRDFQNLPHRGGAAWIDWFCVICFLNGAPWEPALYGEDFEGPLGDPGRRLKCYPPTRLHLLMIMNLGSACE